MFARVCVCVHEVHDILFLRAWILNTLADIERES